MGVGTGVIIKRNRSPLPLPLLTSHPAVRAAISTAHKPMLMARQKHHIYRVPSFSLTMPVLGMKGMTTVGWPAPV